PGGWLVAEEADSLYALVQNPPIWPPLPAGTQRPGAAMTRLWKEIGFDPWWGRNLLSRFCEMGLEHIAGEVRSPMFDSVSSELSLLMLARFRDQMIERGYASEGEFAAWEANAKHPEWRAFLWLLTSVWGQKPRSSPDAPLAVDFA